MSWGAVEMAMVFDPPTVRYDRDVLLTIRTTVPSEVDVGLPPLDDRVRGFILAGSYSHDPVTHAGKTTRELHVRLTPVIAEEHRIAPFAVSYTDRSTSPSRSGWFPTRPVTLPVSDPYDGDTGGNVEDLLDPVWIYPPFRTVAFWASAALLVIAAGTGGWILLRRVHRHIEVRRMSPKERALRELSALLAKGLMGRRLHKEFYLELTMIVRRYIERQHGVRAPEQTTEEFLAAAAEDARFPEHVVAKLRAFLEAADLVKFAAHHPTANAAKQATTTAKEYVQTDAAVESANESGNV